MVVAEKDDVNSWEVMQVHRWVLHTFCGYSRAKVDMVASVEKVRVGHEADALPFEDGGGIADKPQGGILSSWNLWV